MKKYVSVYNIADVEKLLSACEERDERNPLFRSALTAGNRAIVTLFIDTGIRLIELLGLRPKY